MLKSHAGPTKLICLGAQDYVCACTQPLQRKLSSLLRHAKNMYI